MWIHGALERGPDTLYPPTPTQFDELISFLLADGDELPPCPLPIHGTDQNRPRWHASRAFLEFHIFRDKYERKIWQPPPDEEQLPRRVVTTPMDWPEIGDQFFLIEQTRLSYDGHPFDEEGVRAAQKRMSEVTPTSPCWQRGYEGPTEPLP